MNVIKMIFNKFVRTLLYNVDRPWADKVYVKFMYERNIGKKLNLKNPKSFNEIIQWQKLYDHREIYHTWADKIAVKQYIAENWGEQYVIPMVCDETWTDANDIDFEKLPNEFVLKCSHDSGSVVICRDKTLFNEDACRKILNKCLKHELNKDGREWGYKGLVPRIFAEKYITTDDGNVPKDYKVYCFNGEPRLIVVFYNRYGAGRKMEGVYDTNWQKQEFSLDYHWAIADVIEPRPDCLEELLNLSRTICKDMAQVRVDFYIVDGHIYFGEITLYTAGGIIPMIPPEMDEKLGAWIDLERFIKHC